VQNIIALQSFIATENIGGNISQGMTNMKARTTGVGKHIQHIIFGAGRLVAYLINSGRPPVGLPFFFNRSKIVFHNISFNSQGLFITRDIHLQPGKILL
jgi:hypothetical protein